jgi:FixJ family two-component response regulator
LTKHFDDEELLLAVRRAIEQDAKDLLKHSDSADVRQRFESLSPQEREVLSHVVSGSLNKQIGRRLGITEKTIKVHRGQVMQKMRADSLAELVRMAEKLGIRGPQEPSASYFRRSRMAVF